MGTGYFVGNNGDGTLGDDDGNNGDGVMCNKGGGLKDGGLNLEGGSGGQFKLLTQLPTSTFFKSLQAVKEWQHPKLENKIYNYGIIHIIFVHTMYKRLNNTHCKVLVCVTGEEKIAPNCHGAIVSKQRATH